MIEHNGTRMLENLRPWQPEIPATPPPAPDERMWPADAGPWKRFVDLLLGHRSPRRTFQRSLVPADAIAAIKRFGGTIVCNEARPERPILEIDLSGPQWPNAVMLHIRQCKQLVRSI